MPTVINFYQPDKVAVLVHDVTDGTIVTRMVTDIQRVFRHIVGGWRVNVSSVARGCWRLELTGDSGRHIWMFCASADGLPAAVVEKLESFLHDSATAWRLLRSGA